MASVELVSLDWGYEDIVDVWHDHECGSVGVQAYVSLYNASEKEIKYITVYLAAYNAVNDCLPSAKNSCYTKITGPVKPNDIVYHYSEALWGDPTVNDIGIRGIKVEFMDGTTESIPAENLVLTASKESIYYEKRGRDEEEKKKQEKIEAELKIKKSNRITAISFCATVAVGLIILFIYLIMPTINAKRISVAATGMEAYRGTYNGLSVKIDFDVANDSGVVVNKVEGILTISDKNGNVLSTGPVNFSGIIDPRSSGSWVLTWTMPDDENAQAIYNGRYEDFVFSFDVTEVSFYSGRTATVK